MAGYSTADKSMVKGRWWLKWVIKSLQSNSANIVNRRVNYVTYIDEMYDDKMFCACAPT